MLGNNKLDPDQLNRCVKRYGFLSPNSSTSFSNYSQRTECDLSSSSSSIELTPQKISLTECPSISRTHQPSSFWRLLLPWKASCETKQLMPTATDRMERAKESLKQAEAARSGVIISEMDIQNFLAKETGRDRLFKMFTKDHMGNSSPELKFITQVTMQSAAVTFLVMATLAGRQAKQDFIERNRPTVFKTRFQAFRRMQDAIFLFSMKEGTKWAFRVSLFSLSFLGISQTIAVYRNKSSAWEYAAPGGATMGLLKANMGLRGFAVGSGLGTVIGFLMGFALLGAMKGLNETQEQRHYWQIHKELEKERLFEAQDKLPDRSSAETA